MREEAMETKGLVLCLSGPSGVGKGTVIDAVRRQYPGLSHSVSVTTREPRPGEVDGVHYHFRSREAFEAMLEAGEILEHDVYLGNYYGTPLQSLIDQTQAGQDVIMDITVPGSLETLARFPDAISVFLLPPSFTELRRRLTGRGTESAEVIERRLEQAAREMREAPRFKYIVVNHDVEQSAQRILAILQAEHQLTAHLAGIEEIIANR